MAKKILFTANANLTDLQSLLKTRKSRWTINEKLYSKELFDIKIPNGAKSDSIDSLKHVVPVSSRFRRYSIYTMDNGKLTKKLAVKLPAVFDWRTMGDVVSPIKNQGNCNTCVAFATAASIESLYRIQNYNSSDYVLNLSEAGLILRNQESICSNGWNISGSLFVAKNDGICLEYNYPYSEHEKKAMKEGSNRIVKVGSYETTNDVRQMKKWLCENGPLITRFDTYVDFNVFWHSASDKDQVYERQTEERKGLGHAVCVVGYDDNKKAWICKNSWGTSTLRPDGCFYIGYGECGIDNCMFLPIDITDKITCDYISYNPSSLKIVKETSCWLLTDGRSRMKVLATEEDANNALKVAKRHTRHCFVGRSNKRADRKQYILEYWDGTSDLTVEEPTNVTSLTYLPNSARVRYNSSTDSWNVQVQLLKSKDIKTLFTADTMADALAALSYIETKKKICYIGKDNKMSNPRDYIMTYFE